MSRSGLRASETMSFRLRAWWEALAGFKPYCCNMCWTWNWSWNLLFCLEYYYNYIVNLLG